MSTASEAKSSSPPLIAVYDFDHTLYDENTDMTAISMDRKFGHLVHAKYRESGRWTLAMDYVLSKVHEDGHSVVDIREKLIAYPFTPGMIEAIKRFGELGVPQFILSDANSYFINALLDASGLRKYFPPHHIFTNPAVLHDDGRLSISGCQKQTWHKGCAPNMCKGSLLHKIWALPELNSGSAPPADTLPQVGDDLTGAKRAEALCKCHAALFDFMKNPPPAYSYKGVTAYFGDGGNDLCSALQLRRNDFACARDGFEFVNKISRVLTKMQTAKESGAALQHPSEDLKNTEIIFQDDVLIANVREWGADGDGKDVAAVVEEILRSAGVTQGKSSCC